MRHPVGLAVQIVESGRGWVVARYGLATRRHEVDWSNPKPPGAYLIKRVAGVWKKELAELPLEPWPLPGPIGIAGLVAAIDPPPLHPTAPGFWTRDPDGNLVELSVHADKRVVNLTGLPAAALEGQDVDFLIDPTNSPDVYYLKPRETLYAAVPTLTVPPVTHLKRYKLALAQFQAMALAPSVPEVAVREADRHRVLLHGRGLGVVAERQVGHELRAHQLLREHRHGSRARGLRRFITQCGAGCPSVRSPGTTEAVGAPVWHHKSPLRRRPGGLRASRDGWLLMRRAKVRCLGPVGRGRLVWTANFAGLIALFEASSARRGAGRREGADAPGDLDQHQQSARPRQSQKTSSRTATWSRWSGGTRCVGSSRRSRPRALPVAGQRALDPARRPGLVRLRHLKEGQRDLSLLAQGRGCPARPGLP